MSTCKGKSKSECKLSEDCIWVQPKNRKNYCRRRPSPRRQSKTDRKRSSSRRKSPSRKVKKPLSECKGTPKNTCKSSDKCLWVQPKSRKSYCRRKSPLKTSPKRRKTLKERKQPERESSSQMNKQQIPVDIVNMIMSYTQHRDLHPRVENYLERNPEYYYQLSANSNPLVGSFLLEKNIPGEKMMAFGGGINDDRIVKKIVSTSKEFSDEEMNFIASNKNDLAVKYVLKKIMKDNRRVPFELSRNPHPLAVKYFLNNPQYIQGSLFSMNTNPSAVKFMVENHDLIDWRLFSLNTNPVAVKFIVNKHPDKIDWKAFSGNTNTTAVKYMIKHSDKIKWRQFSTNTNPLAVKYLIRERSEKIRWSDFVMKNSNDLAVDYMLKHPKKLRPDFLVFNENKRVVAYLLKNYNDSEIYWEQLLENPCIFIKSKELKKILLDV